MTDRSAPMSRREDDRFAEHLRGFGPIGLLAIAAVLVGDVLFVPLSALLVLAWARHSYTPLRDLGFVRPQSWPRTIGLGLVFGVAFKLVMKAVVLPLLGAPPTNQAFGFLAGNPVALPGMILLIFVGAGFGEETVYRGFLFARFGRLVGTGAAGTATTVLLTSVWFGLIHYPVQGVFGVLQAFIVGIVFGAVFSVTRRVWALMVAHVAFDLTAVALIFWRLEVLVARAIFG